MFEVSDLDLADRIKELEEEKEVIKDKLLNKILDYNRISNANWNMGLRETVESLHDDVESLFKSPRGFTMQYFAEDCSYCEKVDDGWVCKKFNKVLEEGRLEVCFCEDFEWR